MIEVLISIFKLGQKGENKWSILASRARRGSGKGRFSMQFKWFGMRL